MYILFFNWKCTRCSRKGQNCIFAWWKLVIPSTIFQIKAKAERCIEFTIVKVNFEIIPKRSEWISLFGFACITRFFTLWILIARRITYDFKIKISLFDYFKYYLNEIYLPVRFPLGHTTGAIFSMKRSIGITLVKRLRGSTLKYFWNGICSFF